MNRNHLLFLALLGVCLADEMKMDPKSENADEHLAALRKGITGKMMHWFISVFALVIVPAVATCYAIANRYRSSMALQICSGAYSVLDALVLRFPDPDGHENRTSRGTAWFLMFFYGLVLLNGSICEGSNVLAEKFDSNLGRIGQRLTPTSYKILSGMATTCGFVKAGMNVVAIAGFCYGMHTGQCNAHGIMGMSFIGYGCFMATMLVIPWLRINKHAHSQEWYDSVMITAWGIVNTFTEHRPWEPWSHHDYQHTSMGIIFWACGMLGVYLSRNNKRSFLPGLTMILTGWAMSEHSQKLMTSAKVHTFFGLTLMMGGAMRIVEISFVLSDRRCDPSGHIKSFQYIAPFSLVLAGTLFMGANEEQIQLVVDMGADHGAYVLVATSAACLVYLFFLCILDFYLRLCGVQGDTSVADYEALGGNVTGADGDLGAEGTAGNTLGAPQFRDSNSFELGDLSDDPALNPAQHV